MLDLQRFDFSDDFQDLILACFIRNPSDFTPFGEIIQPKFFNGSVAFDTCHEIKEFNKKYGSFPTFVTLGNSLWKRFVRRSPDRAKECVEYVKKLTAIQTNEFEAVRDMVVAFAKERAVQSAFRVVLDAQHTGEEIKGGIVKLFEEAVAVGTNTEDLGLWLHCDIDLVRDKLNDHEYGTPTGFRLLDEVWKRGFCPGWLIVPLAPPKRWKCLGKGTGILMFDGTVKPVEQIKVGDLLMGDDSTPRKVTSCGDGQGPLYSVKQASGNNFICNDAHVLCLKFPDGKIKEMPAEDYAKQRPWFKRQWQGYKTGVEFPRQNVPLDPYFFGLWLGDGTSAEASVCVSDEDHEIAAYLHNYAAKLNLRISFDRQKTGCRQFNFAKAPKRNTGCSVAGCSNPHRAGGFCHKHYCSAYYRHGFRAIPDGKPRWNNPITGALKSLTTLNNKHIPDVYKHNSRAYRLELLAGLIDSDGTLTEDRGFSLELTNQRLASDICWLARSLGFIAQTKPRKTKIKSTGYTGKAWCVTIMGTISEIPTILPRKRSADSFKHKLSRYKIKVTPIGNGTYYGFTVDGNNRFLLEDFTVTHNTTFCLNLALNITNQTIGKNVFYYACEISQELAFLRALHNLTQKDEDFFWTSPNIFWDEAKQSVKDHGDAKLMFKSFAANQASIADIKAHAKNVIKTTGIEPGAIVVDYTDTVRPADTKLSDWRQQAAIYTDARAMGDEFKCPVIMPDRCTAETVDKKVPNLKSFQGSFQKGGIVDAAIGLCATEAEYQQGVCRYFIFVNRHGPQYLHFRGKVDPARFTMTIDEQIAYNPEAEEKEEAERGGKRRRGKGDFATKERQKEVPKTGDFPQDD